MLKLVVIDLSSADIARFESYEKQVLPLLDKYGARLELCVRSTDGKTETHLLYFPDTDQFNAFLVDPERAALHKQWQQSGASSTVSSSISDVEPMNYE